MKKVVGVFGNIPDADKCITELMYQGFEKSHLSLIVSDKGRISLLEDPKVLQAKSEKESNDLDHAVLEGSAAGAAIGGTLGALIAGLTAVGSITVAGAGVLVAGPLVAVFSGLGAGVLVGGLSGALIRMGFHEDEAGRYEEEIRQGKAVIVVEAENTHEVEKATTALHNMGAVMEPA